MFHSDIQLQIFRNITFIDWGRYQRASKKYYNLLVSAHFQGYLARRETLCRMRQGAFTYTSGNPDAESICCKSDLFPNAKFRFDAKSVTCLSGDRKFKLMFNWGHVTSAAIVHDHLAVCAEYIRCTSTIF
jgi:hypothetical protein